MAIAKKYILLFSVSLHALSVKTFIQAREQGETPDTPMPTTPEYPTPSSSSGTGNETGSRDIYESLTLIELGGTSVDICTQRHLCSSLGCSFQPHMANSSSAAPLCQCDGLCNFFHDCCIDYEGTCMTTANDEFSTSQRLGKLTLVDFKCNVERFQQSEGYYVIAVCPNDNLTGEEVLRQRCEQIDTDDFLSEIPVLGVKNHFPYRNVYCALCWRENVTDLEPWSLTFECTQVSYQEEAFDLLSLSTSRETLDIIRYEVGCILVKEPPGRAGSAVRTCYLDARAECPIGHPLAPLCSSYTALTATVDFVSRTLYKNPHCLICNNNKTIDFVDCLRKYPVLVTDDTLYRPPAPAPQFPGPPPISIVFDFRSAGNVKLVSEGRVVVSEVPVTCSVNEVYDPFLSRCRRLTCADGYALEGERCVRLAGDIHVSGQEMITYFHVAACADRRTAEDPLEEIIKTCLDDLVQVNRSQMEISTMDSELLQSNNCLGQPGKRPVVFAFMTRLKRAAFQEVHQKVLAMEGRTFCSDLADTTSITSMEILYHDASLSLARCAGRWQNVTADSDLAVPRNMTIWRETFDWLTRQPPAAISSPPSQVQLCQNPDLSCLLETFNRSLFLPAGDDENTLVYMPTRAVFNRDSYIETADGEIQVCSFNEQNGTRNITQTFTFFQYSLPQQILNLTANIVSMLAAVVTFVTFCVFKKLRNRTSGPILNFTAALFLAQLLLLLSGVATQAQAACTIVALLAHYFLLVSVMWTGVLAFILNRTFTAWKNTCRSRSTGVSLASLSFAWGVPLLIALPCFILHVCDCTDLPLWYGNEHVCWIGNGYVSIVVVGVPIGAVVLTNIVLFSLTVCGIRKTKRDTQHVLSNKPEMQQIVEEVVIYIKIATLMGFTWIFGFAAAISDVVALWYVFILLNSSQALYIFFAFICNKKVWCFWKRTARSTCGPWCGKRHDDGSVTKQSQTLAGAKTYDTGL
ncbi:uncharacterized protein LOC110985037 [Acanthaster planci]|uniref:Uncharacterized protein LOC110985037 n=1 Tax=Acanthaster planci TaxID=133434 RepID=A0A8B7ZDZ9_ACAPL|nr:uncharacterized protein LOC110985037 [Acanthaster planci]